MKAARQKWEAIEDAASEDAWTPHVAERSMPKGADQDIERVTVASPREALEAALEPGH